MIQGMGPGNYRIAFIFGGSKVLWVAGFWSFVEIISQICAVKPISLIVKGTGSFNLSLTLLTLVHIVMSLPSSLHWSGSTFPWPFLCQQLMAAIFVFAVIIEDKGTCLETALVDQVGWSLDSFHPSSWSTEIGDNFDWNNLVDDCNFSKFLEILTRDI